MKEEKKIDKSSQSFALPENAEHLLQLSKTLEESSLNLIHEYKRKNYDEFNKLKALLLQIQSKILEMLR